MGSVMKKSWLLLAALLPSLSLAEPQTDIDPLTLAVRTVWGPEIKTVEDAVDWIIEPTGYRLVTSYPAPTESARIAQRSLPPVIKLHRTMPIIDALQLLAGMDNTVIIDKRNKLISFQYGTQP